MQNVKVHPLVKLIIKGVHSYRDVSEPVTWHLAKYLKSFQHNFHGGYS